VPELPEVETIRRSLERRVIGRSITRVLVHEPRFRTRLDAARLEEQLAGRRIATVGRRSKYLLLHLDDGQVLVLHLGMSGWVVVEPALAPLAAHTHVVLELDRGDELRFADPRRFGMLFVLPTHGALLTDRRLATLGPEPLSSSFDLRYLTQRACRVRKPVKNFLLDGSVVAGVGNIYACETLFQAGINPRTPAGRLGPARLQRLHESLVAVLLQAVRAGGTTLQDYRDSDGRRGAYQRRLRVYGRESQPCRKCGRRVRRVVQAGRSTFYCPGCQH
jgi:formamidopyrimidine-DNA glycosylase